ncbi:MAG: hypothetical protein K2K92_09880, partial [Duncaniella sp.]|nr:hypothetical protein [Duncaniella sp.]
MIMHLGGDNSQFTLKTNRQDSLYVFEAGCDGYTPQTFTYRVADAKKEWKLEMPTIYLERAPHKLNELTVTTSKVKFYHRGDTLVYNADAFQLAEGSMLDGLIKQLPGAELSSDGRITVNGEFVETLLLDGKPFFDGNNNLMLKNIGAYMVKNVEVYRGQTAMEKFINNPDAPKHLTMNVKLKKEYNIGWIANVQAGYGTDDRYLGRLFAAWFNPRARVGLVANFNNLNDTRTPGENDNWTPEQMPSGTQRSQIAGMTYNLSDADNKKTLSGNVTYERSTLDLRTSTDRTNFFNSGNIYDYTKSTGVNKDMNLSTSHRYNLQFPRVNISGDLKGGYRRQDTRNASASASFNKEQADNTMQSIEAIYSIGDSESYQSLINRAITLSDGTNKKGNFDFSANTLYKIPRSSNMIRFEASIKYDTQKETLWDDYDIAYGSNQSYGGLLDSEHRRNYTDNSPNYKLNLNGILAYMTNIGKVRVTMGYVYMFNRHVRDSYMYTLDRLADMGIFGTLPAGYVSSFDPGNSFVSTQWDNRNSAMMKFAYNLFKNGNNLYISGGLDIGAQHSHLNYFSDGRSYPVRYNSMVATVGKQQTSIIYMPKATPKKIKNRFRYDYTLDTDIPDLLHFVDVVNNSDPLNINLGNPNLKNSYKNNHRFSWQMNNSGWRNDLLLTATHTANALLRGYVYDMETGVRYNRTY